MLKFFKHVFVSSLPWNFKWYIWVFFGVWFFIGPVIWGEGAFALYSLFLRFIYAAVCSIALNVTVRGKFPLKTLVSSALAVFFTILAPYAVPLGAAIIMVPYFGGLAVIGEVSNPPFSQCENLPHANELDAAVKAGLDVNGKCCFDTMIGSCIVVTPEKRTLLYIDAIMSSPLYSDEDVLAYLDKGASPTRATLIEASALRSEKIIKKILDGNYSINDYMSGFLNSLAKNSEISPIMKGKILEKYGEKEFRFELLKAVKYNLSKAYSGIHFRDSTLEIEGLKRLIKEESLMEDTEVREVLLCSLLNQPRTVPHKTEETRARFDLALESLMRGRLNGDAKCYTPGSSFEPSLKELASNRASTCEGEDCEIYRKILGNF